MEGTGELPLRRRREGSTDYGKRLELLKSEGARAVIRVSNNHCQVQIVEYSEDRDETVASAFSKELADLGWEHHTGNLPAAYLTGFLAGHRAKEEGVKKAVADLGGEDREEGNRHYAAVKGLKDSGFEVPAGEEVLPEDGRVEGGNFETVKDEIESGGV
ncbi:MAG: 50S ribosomal protein L18 [Candidatus Nanohaloarchaea archaeon]|nr:50S ribosomal protein L18 [Candidatus Nanohaloarchaea archaeon]